ncbi:hypothetical protein IPL85_00090 [Candidatus Saccharibacteria bacterium]|nr:MAG: hypothetical protein IPL85_00090 [Candidatus Saccharibacteria bacterium]
MIDPNHEALSSPQPWGGTTDPAVHDPSNFRYLVHAVNPSARLNALIIASYDTTAGVTYDPSWGDQKISMYDQPERAADRVSLSTSLIDTEHTGTWGEAGLILEAPEPNVILTSDTDVGARNNNLDALLKQADNHGVMDADSLLAQTYPSSYNEVVVVAKRDEQPVNVKGFFYKVTQSGKPYNPQLALRMQSHAERLGLPVVPIVEKGLYADDKVEEWDGKIAVHHGGNRVLLTGFEPQSQFRVYDERQRARFATPEDIDGALSFATQTGKLELTEAQLIAEAYRTADKKRQTPAVEFDEDGTVKGIAYITGYGDAETKVSLGKRGHSYRTNLKRQSEKIQEVLLSMGGPGMIGFDSDNDYQPISPFEASSMVEQACAGLDDEHADQVRQWYQKHRGVTEQQWQHHQSSRKLLGSYGMQDSDYNFDKEYPRARQH